MSVTVYLKLTYCRFKGQMWQMAAAEMGVPWWSAEFMHWQLGEQEMSARANVFVNQVHPTATGTAFDDPSEITAGFAKHQLSPPLPQDAIPPMAASDLNASSSPLLSEPSDPKKARTAETVASHREPVGDEVYSTGNNNSGVDCERVFFQGCVLYKCPHCTYMSGRRWNCYMHMHQCCQQKI
jgi:hypothetical protein